MPAAGKALFDVQIEALGGENSVSCLGAGKTFIPGGELADPVRQMIFGVFLT